MSRISRLTVALMFLAVTAALAQGDWLRYTNARFAYGIDIPPGFTKGAAPANNDGRTFKAADGATLDVWGANNVTSQVVTSAYEGLLAEKGQAVAYKTKGRDWFVVSWEASGRIFYQKQYVGSGAINAFLLSYPATRKAAYAPTVMRVERSFKPGGLSQAH